MIKGFCLAALILLIGSSMVSIASSQDQVSRLSMFMKEILTARYSRVSGLLARMRQASVFKL